MKYVGIVLGEIEEVRTLSAGSIGGAFLVLTKYREKLMTNHWCSVCHEAYNTKLSGVTAEGAFAIKWRSHSQMKPQ